MATKTRQRLIIFVKSPIAGKVKTRLTQASKCSDEQACFYYQAMVACVFEHISDYSSQIQQSLNVHIGYTLSDDSKSIKKWLTPYLPNTDKINVSYFEQLDSACLGDRIHHAFTDSFAQGFSHVGIIGTDCVDITPKILHALFNSTKPTIGPTYDGGYYGLSLHSEYFHDQPELLKRLFTHINWSCETTYQNTLYAAQSIHLELSELPKLHDIDYFEDWERALQSTQGTLLTTHLSNLSKQLKP